MKMKACLIYLPEMLSTYVAFYITASLFTLFLTSFFVV